MSLTPFLMFQGEADAAMTFYLSLFPDSHIESLRHFGEEGPGKRGTVAEAVVTVKGQRLRFFDSPVVHAFGFTPAISLFVDCAAALEADALFEKLADGGQVLMPLQTYPFARRFGWCNDRFGVSWQIRFP